MSDELHVEPWADEQIVVRKSELLELMGELALPPFGGVAPVDTGSWEVYPFAENVSRRVDEFFQQRLPGSVAPGQQVFDVPPANRRITDNPQA